MFNGVALLGIEVVIPSPLDRSSIKELFNNRAGRDALSTHLDFGSLSNFIGYLSQKCIDCRWEGPRGD